MTDVRGDTLGRPMPGPRAQAPARRGARAVLAALLAAVVLAGLFGTAPAWAEAWAEARAAARWQTAAELGATPKWIPHDTGWQGYCPDLFAALHEQDPALRFDIRAHAMPQKRLEAALLAQQVQVICTLTRIPHREGHFAFVEPALYRLPYALAARADDPVTVQSWDDVRQLGKDGTILLNHDSSRVSVLSALGGLTLRTEGVSTEANLRMLLAGRGRFFYFPRVNLLAAAQQMGIAGKIKLLLPDAEAQPYHLLIHPQTAAAERERLERALAALAQAGTLHRIAERWHLE